VNQDRDKTAAAKDFNNMNPNIVLEAIGRR